MDKYEKISYRELQQEAKKLGVKSLRVTRERLLEQIHNILNEGEDKPEEEKKEKVIPEKRARQTQKERRYQKQKKERYHRKKEKNK